MSTRRSGIHGSTMFPAISRIAHSTPSSMSMVTTSDAVPEATSSSRGKYTFLMRLPLPTIEPSPMLRPFWKRFHGTSAQSRKSANECRPLGSPVGGSIFRKNAEDEGVDARPSPAG